MTLSSFGNPAWDTIRGVRFWMRDGPTLVAVLVTHEALDNIEHEAPVENAYLARFNRHRSAVEQAASAKFQRGEVEETGAVIMQASDLKSPRS